MAEAHQAVAFQFTVTPEGIDLQLSHQALTEIYLSGMRSWKKRIIRLKNSVITGVYPASPSSWLFVVIAILATMYTRSDPSMGLIAKIQEHLPVRHWCVSFRAESLFSTVTRAHCQICLCPPSRTLSKGLVTGGRNMSTCVGEAQSWSTVTTMAWTSCMSHPHPSKQPGQATAFTHSSCTAANSTKKRLNLVVYQALSFLCVQLSVRGYSTPHAFRERRPWLLRSAVPCCSYQFERMFDTCRIPGTLADTVQHWQDSDYIVVYHRGRYFRLRVYQAGRLLSPREIEFQIQRILDDPIPACKGETKLGALTAGDRIPWAKARAKYFNSGVNKRSLDCIERAAFFVTLDDDEQGMMGDDPEASLDCYAKSLLHGKCYDRWFDKSFSVVYYKNGKNGINGEHSWADAPVLAHLWEYTLATDSFHLGYNAEGHCKGEVDSSLPRPQKLNWEIPPECEEQISRSLAVAQALADDVDFHVFPFRDFGKGKIKKCRVSPDGFIQTALQLAYYRERRTFCLTYEASMTRLFREGRTETVRSCTNESSAFVRALEGGEAADVCRRLFRTAAEKHQLLYRMAMTGAGIDRHLFCLYVVSKYLGVESPFLNKVLSEPWRLSTSQTPVQQVELFDMVNHPEYISCGGGFGPVADDGYGVSYCVLGDNLINFHISCKHSCPDTDARKFGAQIRKALHDLIQLLNPNQKDSNRTEESNPEVKKDL
ncbi:carnitine O-palmitoyltransferase 1, liver isoform-like isoform X4 [Channa argus]|uniref:carnitine O-palmitoyltransferase 1, liver isoform-like isoform X4 n=1 Tax=Channa argus TaxID=215402 RepID=UPI003522A0E8